MASFESLYSENARNMKKSVIRELLKLRSRSRTSSRSRAGFPLLKPSRWRTFSAAADAVFVKHATKALAVRDNRRRSRTSKTS
ncbi:MAG: hypothetical protein M0C28_41650 [Candidatus Moduliflexus flocculans]|nr:hypothetical protein [Candidatus Moduliflexus flocculans]